MIGRNFPSYKKELWQQITLPEPFFIQIQKNVLNLSGRITFIHCKKCDYLHLFVAKNAIIYIYSLHFLSVF